MDAEDASEEDLAESDSDNGWHNRSLQSKQREASRTACGLNRPWLWAVRTVERESSGDRRQVFPHQVAGGGPSNSDHGRT